MINPADIVKKFRESSITFVTGPSNGTPSPKPGPQRSPIPEKPKSPRMRTLQQQVTRQEQQLEQTKKKIQLEKQKKAAAPTPDADMAREQAEKETVARDLGLRDVNEIESLVGRRGQYGVILSDRGKLGPGIEQAMARVGLRNLKTGYTFYYGDWSFLKSKIPLKTAFDVGPKSEKFTKPEQYKSFNTAKQVAKTEDPSTALTGFKGAWQAWGPVFYLIALNASHALASKIWDVAIATYGKNKSNDKMAQNAVQVLKSKGFKTDKLEDALEELKQPDIWLKTPKKKLEVKPKPEEDIFVTPQKTAPKREEETMFVRSHEEWIERISSISDRLARVNPDLASRLNDIAASVVVGASGLEMLPLPLVSKGHRSRLPYRVIKQPRVTDPDPNETFGDPEDDVTMLFPSGLELKVKVKDLKNVITKK